LRVSSTNHSETITDMKTNPVLAVPSTRTFGTVEAATAVTGSPLVERLLPA
jgi:hypothetical protein